MDPDWYVTPGPMTGLGPDQLAVVRALDPDPLALCRVVQGLFTAPPDARGTGLSPERSTDRSTRPATRLLERVLGLDPSPLDTPRSTDRRVVGTCRHYAVLSTALLRATGTPARARCGFAAYFDPPRKVDHWIVEHWDSEDRRWVRTDAEVLDHDLPANPADLGRDDFLTGGEAWQRVRSGDEDASLFGVHGTDHWGPAEIRGNVIRDLAALQKVEVLPWDEWGPMQDSYEGRTDSAFDELMDDAAAACAGEDDAELARVSALLAVPDELVG